MDEAREPFSPHNLDGLRLGLWAPAHREPLHWLMPLLADSGCELRRIEEPAMLAPSEDRAAPDLDILLIDATHARHSADERLLLAQVRLHVAPHVPLVLVGTARSGAERLAAIQAGAARYLNHPPGGEHLRLTLFELGFGRGMRGARVLLAGLGAAQRDMALAFREAGLNVIEVSDVAHLVERLGAGNAELLVLGDELPEGRSGELARWLLSSEQTRELSLLCLSKDRLDALTTNPSEWTLMPPHHPERVLASVRRCLFEHRRLLGESVLSARAREADRLERHWHTMVLDTMPCGATLIDARLPEFPLIRVNPGFVELSGYPEEELLGRACPCLTTGPDAEDHKALMELRASLLTGSATRVMLRNTRKDGSLFWNQITLVPLRAQRDLVTHFVGIHQDITMQREAALIKERAAEQVLSVIDSLRSYICVIDAEGVVISSNRAWKLYSESLGHSLRRIDEGGNYLTHCDRLGQLGARDAADLAHGIREVLAERLNSYEARVYVSRGVVEEVHLVRVTRLQGTEPGDTRLVVSHQDITTQVQIEADLRAAKDEAERANQAKSEFLSLMSHELRTPMNAVLGFAQLLECDPQLNDEQRENVVEILRGGRLLLELINEMLDLSRVEFARVDLHLAGVVLEEAVADCLELVEPLAHVRDIQLDAAALAGSRTLVWVDQVRLRQVLIHLLSNAIQYNDPLGRVSLALSTSTEGGGMACLEVRDTGKGVDAEQLSELFEPFGRHGSEGYGIGLAVSRRLIEAMGGRIGARSQPGQGSEFWIELPLQQASPGEGPDTDEAGASNALPGCREPMLRVLQIEDDRSNLRLIERALVRRPELRLLTAPSGQIGLELARVHCPDLILMSRDLPDTDALEVLRALRNQPETQGIPVVCLSAAALSQAERKDLRAAGFAAILAKPLDITSLFTILDRLLEHEA
ncbi:MAG: PAS domain S-box protein [Chromatiaceae bacterium]|nr:PAS domain S-box protein [Chromatiaceae bacterium]